MTIYFLSPMDLNAPATGNAPVGGVKALYRVVDMLNESGWPACVLHQKPQVRCTWFENQTRTACVWDTKITADDYLVMPEIFGPLIGASGHGIRKVIFNQNAYYSFHGYGLDRPMSSLPYRHPDVVATIVVSEDNARYLTYVFPDAPIYRLHLAVNTELFDYSQSGKRDQICFMPRKNEQDVMQVINILKARQALHGFELIPIDGLSEKDVAQVMRASKIFLSFGYPEGLGLPPLEAMACGCVVIGYHGMGGREFFRPEFSYPIPQGEIIDYARTVEEVLTLACEQPVRVEAQAEAAAAFVRKHYSPQRQREDLLNIWNAIAAQTASRSPT